jgi:hypothetical protein
VATLLGFQGVAFAFCARIYALNEGLLPGDPTLEQMFKRFKLESGLAAGALLVGVGLLGGACVVTGWSPRGFSTLQPRQTLLLAMPSATAVCLGGQVILTSFLLSLIGLTRR